VWEDCASALIWGVRWLNGECAGAAGARARVVFEALDYFPRVSARFTHGMERVQKITILLRHVELERLDRAVMGR
jgi:hypothetical protein